MSAPPGPLASALLLSLGAVAGANARFWLGLWALGAWGAGWPWGTLLINVSASPLLGVLAAAVGWARGRTAA